jgi:hypothetical protein
MAHWKGEASGATLPAVLPTVGLAIQVTAVGPVRAHAIISLALFEAIRSLDSPTDDGLDEFHHELVVKRLGLNRTILAQIERYGRLARADKRVESEEVAALLRLVGRRPDAGLVYAEAGRRAARLAAARVALTLRAARHVLPGRFGLYLARRAAADVFGMRAHLTATAVEAVMDDSLAIRATADGAACGFYGSGLAELLRAFTPFDGALVHDRCRGRGDRQCHWRAGSPAEE